MTPLAEPPPETLTRQSSGQCVFSNEKQTADHVKRQGVTLTDDRRRARGVLLGLGLLLVGSAVVAVGVGATAISPAQVVAILARKIGIALPVDFTVQQANVLWMLRAPRLVFALLAGGGLALAGAGLQGLFRNPLADPALLGISSGAALGAVISIVFGAQFGLPASPQTLPVMAFIGGLAATVLVHRLGQSDGRTDVSHLLLAGIAVNAFCMAGVGLATFLASDAQLRSISFWSLGSLAGASWKSCGIIAPPVFIAAAALLSQARALNALLLGEAEAGHLGFRPENLKRLVILAAALIVSAIVSMTGIIGFIGLVAPHLLRLMIGSNHRRLLPGAAILGALLLLTADTFSRTMAAPAEIPVGVVTSLLGAPFFLWLLQREQRANR